MISPANSPTRSVAPMVRDYLSYSAMNLYRSCPLRYFFKYIVGLPEKAVSSSLVFGCAVHRAVEHHFNELMAGNNVPSAEALLGEYDSAWNEFDPATISYGKDDCRDDLLPLAQRVIGVFQSSALAQPTGRILGVEEELRAQVVQGCPDILGRIDLLVEEDDALVITDVKTARSRWSRDQVDDSAGQLLLYSELAKSLAPQKRLRLQFAVLTKTKEPAVDLHEVPVNTKQIDRTKRIIEQVWQAIEAEVFFPAPSPMQCPSCSFREPCRNWK